MGKHSIGKTIATLRKEKGWTQIELAEKLQVSDKAVSKWEQDNGMPSIEFFPAMAQLFGVSIDYLMTGQTPEKEIITMSKAELCAKNDDVSLLKDIDVNHKDENGKTLVDYIVQYNSEKVFIAFCEINKHYPYISKFNITDALKFCIVLNRLDLLTHSHFILGRSQKVEFTDALTILDTLSKREEGRFQHDYRSRMSCIITDDLLNTIVCDSRINEETLSILLGNQRGHKCVWYPVFPFLIHQAYINQSGTMLDRLLLLSAESNERGFSSYPNGSRDNYYYVRQEYTNKGHGFVRILDETIKIALEKGDFDYVEKFNQINNAVNRKYGFASYVATDDEIKVAKMRLDKRFTPDDIAIQSAIHNGILNIDEIIATNNYELIKKALSAHPIHIVEYLQNLYNAEQYRAIFEWAVDNSNGLADALMSKSDLHIKYVILSDCLKNSSYTNSKHLTLPKYNPTSPNHTIEAWEQVCIAIKNAKQNVLDACAEKFDMTAIFEELSKEYFDLELSKGNTDIVVIKLCVRMEAILRSKGYEGTFEEMLSKYCDAINDSNTISLLHKLRMNRNSIVHSERNAENLSVDEIMACINFICGLA